MINFGTADHLWSVFFGDSIYYISVVRNLLEGRGFVTLFEDPYTAWPPLYSIFISLPSLLDLDPRDVAGPINVIVFGFTILVTGFYLAL